MKNNTMVELIICWTDHSWTTDYVEVGQSDDPGADAIEIFLKEYNGERKENDPDIAYVGVYFFEDIEELQEELGKDLSKEEIIQAIKYKSKLVWSKHNG